MTRDIVRALAGHLYSVKYELWQFSFFNKFSHQVGHAVPLLNAEVEFLFCNVLKLGG